MKKPTKPKGEKKPKKGESQEEAMSCCRPFPVPPSGCPEGWVDNGSGSCVINS